MMFRWANVEVDRENTVWSLTELGTGRELARIRLSNQAYPMDNSRIRHRVERAFRIYRSRDYFRHNRSI